MFKLMGKEINAILGEQTILIWTYDQQTKNKKNVAFKYLSRPYFLMHFVVDGVVVVALGVRDNLNGIKLQNEYSRLFKKKP